MSLIDLFDHFTSKPKTLTWTIENIKNTGNSYNSPKINLSSSDLPMFLNLNSYQQISSVINAVFTFKFDPNYQSSIYYRISLINVKRQKCNTQVGRAKRGFDVRYVFKRDYLFDDANGLLSDGNLEVYFEVYELDDDECMQSCIDQDNLVSLSRDNQSLLDNGELSDVVVTIGGREFKAHKLILSTRSVVFENMFEHDLERDRVEIEDMTASAGEDFLKFIYTGKVSDLELHAYELFVAADKYQIDSLKSYSGPYLTMSHSTSTLPVILQFLEECSQKVSNYSLRELKTNFVDYVTRLKNEFNLDDWNELTTRQSELMYQMWKGGNGL